MQRADTGVRVPRSLRAVLAKDLGQARGVIGEVLERHRAILDEGDRLAVALHRHHDIEPCLAHLPQRPLRRRLDEAHHGVVEAQVGGQLHEAVKVRSLLRGISARELDQQDRLGLIDERALDDGLERGIGAREIDHGAIDELDRRGLERDDVARRLHRAIEGRKVYDAQNLVPR